MRTNIKIEFNICGDYIDVDNVTEMMAIKPIISYLKGDPIKGKPLVRKDTLWAIETEYEEADDIDDVLPKVLKQIIGKTDVIKKIKELYDVNISFIFVINIEDGESPAMYLNIDLIKFAAEIDARIGFDVYVY